MRRTQWLQRSQAVQVINAYAEAMQPKGKVQDNDQAQPERAQGHGLRISGDDMLAKVMGGF